MEDIAVIENNFTVAMIVHLPAYIVLPWRYLYF